MHGHLDVVPADPAEWSVHPFSGAVQDGYVWGRGAVDMKDMVAMTLAVARRFKRDGVVPPRDIVFAFVADEEAGGAYGAQWLVENRPDLFEGCTEAVGEVGGFSLTLGEDQRVYLIEAAEKGIAWMRLRARGKPGHGSFLHDDNAVTQVAEAVARLGNHTFPLVLTDTVRAFLEQMARADRAGVPRGRPGGLDRQARAALADRRGDRPRHREPDDAQGRLQGERHPVDGGGGGRLPGAARAARRRSCARSTSCSGRTSPGSGSPTCRPWRRRSTGALTEAMAAALRAEDPDARRPCPYMLSGGTDAKSFADARACSATGSRRCGCRRTSTSRRSSTASTSGCRSTR